jgi:site-specific DNA-methyltransferase (adenine-specific)
MNFLKGDCLEKMAELPDKSIDLFLCDLPYGCLTGGGGKEKRKRKDIGKNALAKGCWGGKDANGVISGCDWDIPIDLKQFWDQVKRLARDDNTPVLMFCTSKFGNELINSNPSWFRYDLVWSKSNAVGFLCANKMPMRSHEMIFVFSKKGAHYKRVDITGDFPGTSGGTGNIGGSVYNCKMKNKPIKKMGTREGIRCVKSVIEIANKKGIGNHPTQKPAELYKWLLERYCPERGTVLDPTAGSFTSCFAAKELGLRAIGIEKDTNYFWKAVALSNVPTV